VSGFLLSAPVPGAKERRVEALLTVEPLRDVLLAAAEGSTPALILGDGTPVALRGLEETARFPPFKGERGVLPSRRGLVWAYRSSGILDLKAVVRERGIRALQTTLMQKNSVLSALITLSIFAALIIGGWLARNIERPIEVLMESVRRFGRGEFDRKIKVDTHDEIGLLAEAFNQMSDDLRRHVEELRKVTAENERIQTELAMAADLQRSLLPDKAPVVPGFELHGISLPAHEVGGDYYGYIEFDDGVIGVGIGDAVGKGLQAAILIAECRAASMALAIRTRDLPLTLKVTNRLLARDTAGTGRFVTFFASFLDPAARTLVYSRAGHNPPIFLRASDRSTRFLTEGGLILGVQEDSEYAQGKAVLEPGDLVVYYTDGVTEAANASGEMFGSARLRELLAGLGCCSAEEAVEAVQKEVMDFTGRASRRDDVTIVALRAL